MSDLRLTTSRLELVSATTELARAEIADLCAFARLLSVPVPSSWPPPLNDENSQKTFLASLEKAEAKAEAEDAGWNLWFCILRKPRHLLGNVGFKGSPKDGSVEIGYSLLEAHQGHGYCTEAVRALIDWAFAHADVQTIVAHTIPGLVPSIRVMEKCGLAFVGEGLIEDGLHTIRYELPRARYRPEEDEIGYLHFGT